jgi:hypothetical protein
MVAFPPYYLIPIPLKLLSEGERCPEGVTGAGVIIDDCMHGI